MNHIGSKRNCILGENRQETHLWVLLEKFAWAGKAHPVCARRHHPTGWELRGWTHKLSRKSFPHFRGFLFGILSGNSNNNQNKINKQHWKNSLSVVLRLVFSEQKKIPHPESRIWDPVDPAVLCHLSKNLQKGCHKAELEFLRKMILGAGEAAQG